MARGRRLTEGRERAWDSGVPSSQVRFPGPDLEMRIRETIRGGTGQEVWEADTAEDLGGTVCSVASVMSDFFVTPWTVPNRLLCPWGLSRQEYESGLTRLPLGELLNPGWKLHLLGLH